MIKIDKIEGCIYINSDSIDMFNRSEKIMDDFQRCLEKFYPELKDYIFYFSNDGNKLLYKIVKKKNNLKNKYN